MFESKERLQEDVRGLLDALRELGEGRYAALFDAKGVLLQSPDEGLPPQAGMPFGGDLRRLVQSRAEALFALPAALHAPDGPAERSEGGGEMPDLFEAWTEDEFFLAFLNGRVGLLVACPDAKRLEGESGKLLAVMADRLLRFNPAWRLDERGRGLFFGSPRLDTVVIERPSRRRTVVCRPGPGALLRVHASQHPQLLDHRPHRPRQDDALRPPDGADGRAHPAGDDRAVPRLDGPRARARASRSSSTRCGSTTRRRTGRTTSSTSSTPPATWTSPTRSRAASPPARGRSWSWTRARGSRRRPWRTPTSPRTRGSRSSRS